MDISIFGLTPTAVNVIIVTLFLALFLIIVSIKIKQADPSKPSKGLVLVMELIFTGVSNYAKEQIGEVAPRHLPFILTIGLYLVSANLLGLIGLRAPTTDYMITLALTIITLMYIMFSGLFAKGIGGYLKDVYVGAAASAPIVIKQFIIFINMMGELFKTVSLSFRLFGNIMSGAMLLSLVSLLPIYVSLPLFPALNAYFDIFAGLMQTVIFCTLMMMWLKTAAANES